MAKSNSADISDIMEYMASLIEEVTSGEQLKLFSAEMAKIMEEKILKGFQAADPNRLTQKELKEIKEFMKSSFSSMGMGTRMSSAVFEKFFKNLAQEIKAGNQVQMDRLTAVLSNLVSTMISTSEGAREGGPRKEYFKTTEDKTGKMIYEAIAKAMGVKLDEATYKILNMFSGYQQDQKKERRKFADNLIEGLAANKFIGGAMNDTFRLMGLYGASILKQIPLIGKFIAPVFYGVMQALGPLLTQAVIAGIVQGMAAQAGGKLIDKIIDALSLWWLGRSGGKVLTKGMGSVQKAWQSARVSTKSKIPYNFTTHAAQMSVEASQVPQAAKEVGLLSKIGGMFRSSKVLSTTGKVLGKVGGPLAAIGAGVEGVGAYKEAKKGNVGKAWMRGISAATAGAAAASTVPAAAGALETAGLSLLVPAVLSGISIITGLIADWMGDSKKSNASTKDFQDKSLQNQNEIREYAKESWWDKIKDLFTGGSSGYPSYGGSGGSSAVPMGSSGVHMVGNVQLLSGKTNDSGHLNKSLMTDADWQRAETISATYDSTGAITNLGMMSQKHASQVIASDIANRGNKSFYELVPAKYCDMNSFTTDAKAPDNSGVYLARGTTQKYLNMLENLKAQGFDVSGVKITSGIGTLGSRNAMSSHTYSGSSRGHFGSNATVFDITMPRNKKTGQLATAQDLMKAGAQAGTLVEDVGRPNQHAHVVAAPNVMTPKSTISNPKNDVRKTSTFDDKPKTDYSQTHTMKDSPKNQSVTGITPMNSATGNRQFSRANQTAMNVSLWGSDLDYA